jgi:hypothetical protein
MDIKIYDGTPTQTGKSLCETCRHATITRGRRLEEEMVRCEVVPMATTVVRFAVSQCTAYMDARLPSYAQLLEQAWVLTPKEGRRPAGFVRGSDLALEERYRMVKEMREFEE